MFYLRYHDKNKYEQPIEAFAWLGGKYFDTRSNFPAKMGMTLEQVSKLFGKSLASIIIERSNTKVGIRLIAYKFKRNIYAIADDVKKDIIVGYVVGLMPASAKNEQWQGLHQMYRRYTIRPRKF